MDHVKKERINSISCETSPEQPIGGQNQIKPFERKTQDLIQESIARKEKFDADLDKTAWISGEDKDMFQDFFDKKHELGVFEREMSVKMAEVLERIIERILTTMNEKGYDKNQGFVLFKVEYRTKIEGEEPALKYVKINLYPEGLVETIVVYRPTPDKPMKIELITHRTNAIDFQGFICKLMPTISELVTIANKLWGIYEAIQNKEKTPPKSKVPTSMFS